MSSGSSWTGSVLSCAGGRRRRCRSQAREWFWATSPARAWPKWGSQYGRKFEHQTGHHHGRRTPSVLFEQKAAEAGAKLSPTIARAARNWMLWEDAARLAEADRRAGRGTAAEAEEDLAAQRAAEAAESGAGHAA